MKTYDELGLTEMEKKVMEAFIPMLYAEEGFSDVEVADLVKATQIPSTKLRGVLSSLTKKGLIFVEEMDIYREKKLQLIYLSSDFYYLHPRWGKN